MSLKNIILGASLCCAATTWAADADGRQTYLLTGASFAIPENGWFEIGCREMGANAINKAVSGEAIYHTARRMDKGTFYTTAELDDIDIFVIAHVHNQNVANEQWLKDSWEDYTSIATTTDYAVTYDYVIKRYIADCQALEHNPDSKWYGVAGGKPARIMLATHWHDSRTTYNPAIRRLAERWGFPLIEFDTQIGFSRLDVASGEAQPSLAMAHDTETINGVKYGWHPLRGDNSPVQQRMAKIFVDKVAEYTGKTVPFEVGLRVCCPMLLPGDCATAKISFHAGMFPYTASVGVSDTAYNLDGVDGHHHLIEHADVADDMTFVLTATDSRGNAANEVSAPVRIARKAVAPSFDSFIHEAYKDKDYTTAELLELKNGDNWSRKIYVTFPLTDIEDDDTDVTFRLFFESYVAGKLNNENRPFDGIEELVLEGNTTAYDKTLKWNGANAHTFEYIATQELPLQLAGKWVGWDVSSWVRARKAEGATRVTFRVSTTYRWRALTRFIAADNTEKPHLAPQLLLAKAPTVSGIAAPAAESGLTITGQTITNTTGCPVAIYSADGRAVLTADATTASIAALAPGIYIARAGTKYVKFVR